MMKTKTSAKKAIDLVNFVTGSSTRTVMMIVKLNAVIDLRMDLKTASHWCRPADHDCSFNGKRITPLLDAEVVSTNFNK
jgi:hypothetical protein